MLRAIAVGNLIVRTKPIVVCSPAALWAVLAELPLDSSFALEELTGHLLVFV
jgi:hypothetical protein